MSETIHKSVLKKECLKFLLENNVKSLIDCNLGEGGHSRYFLENIPALKIEAIDCDESIIERAEENLKDFSDRIKIYNFWSNDFLKTKEDLSFDCIFFDLGLSMFHYKNSRRGFSFNDNDSLDMRLSKDTKLMARDVVNKYPEKKLADILYNNADETNSRKIASAILQARKKKEIETATELDAIVSSCFHFNGRRKTRPSTKTFQAIRIEVNDELNRLKSALMEASRIIKTTGIMVVITFHSAEDRIVKYFFRELEKKESFKILTKKPISPSWEEIKENPSSRTSKLRVLKKL